VERLVKDTQVAADAGLAVVSEWAVLEADGPTGDSVAAGTRESADMVVTAMGLAVARHVETVAATSAHNHLAQCLALVQPTLVDPS
jgi:hypothetical protein